MSGRISGGTFIRQMLSGSQGPADEESSRSRAWHRPADEDVSSTVRLHATAAGSQKRGCGKVST